MKEDNILKIIGNNIKSARISKGITQGKLSEQLDKSEKFVSMIERRKKSV